MLQQKISQAVLDVLSTFPPTEREQALEAIESGSEWEQEIEYGYEGIDIYYLDDDRWRQYTVHTLFCVQDGVLKFGHHLSYPCGDREWSEFEEDFVVVDGNFNENSLVLWDKLYAEHEEDVAEYQKWVEDNGKDPLEHYWLAFSGERIDTDDRLQVSLQAWKANNQLDLADLSQQELNQRILERFPEGFMSSYRVGRTVVEYPVKHHCGQIMKFEAEFPASLDSSPESAYETYVGWTCEDCGHEVLAGDDEIVIRMSESYGDDE
jgi:hypothetical protein